MLLRAITCLGLLLPSAAAAGPVFDRVAGGGGAPPCFARVYDAAHLARNPDQRVTFISLRRDVEAPASENSRRRFTVAIHFRTRDSRERFEVNGICTTRGEVADCGGEGDTGAFRLSLTGSAIRMAVSRLEVEGLDGDLAQSDDRVFLIGPAAASACR
jgi:hypothetical protein